MTDHEGGTALGWASIGIGLAEIFAPKQVEQMLGIEQDNENTGILRVLGVREIMTGVDILSHEDPTPGVWGRVAGDAVDLALLGIAARKTRNPGGLAGAFAMVLGITALDAICAGRLTQNA